ncbi:unnamed protein product [Caenorhabditis brenneri]
MQKRNPNHFDYTAIVITSTDADAQQYETDLVLLLKSHRERLNLKNLVYGIAKEAFHPPEIENDFENIEEAKNRERRYAIPLKFGDIVQFDEKDVDHKTGKVKVIRREKPLFKTSSNDAGPLLRIGGCIDPRKPTTFWTPLEPVTIPIQDAARAEPDVWMHAWIRVDVHMRCSTEALNIEWIFDDFADFDPADQGRVSEAPWQKASLESKFTLWQINPFPCDDDFDIDLEPRKDVAVVENKWSEVINKQLGLFVGERLLLCKDLPQYDFIIPLVKPISSIKVDNVKKPVYPTVGEYFHFGAIWSSHHQAFLVTDMVQVPVLRSHSITPSGNLLLRVITSGVRGLFTDKNGTLGLIDDPYQSLALFEFHPACYEGLTALVEVRAVRATENRSVRYRIIKVITDDENMSRFDTWINDAEFTVGPLAGVVTSRDTVVCGKYPNVYFRLPSDRIGEFPIGCGVRVFGSRMMGATCEIAISEIYSYPEHSIQKVVANTENPIFQVELKPMWQHVQLCESEHFGIVDMRNLNHPPQTQEEIMNNQYSGPFLAWVRESTRVRGSRRACVMMEVYSMALNTPIVFPTTSTSGSKTQSRNSSEKGARKQTPSGSSAGSSCGSNRSSINSIATNRFVGPSRRKTQEDYESGSSSARSSASHATTCSSAHSGESQRDSDA